MPHRILILPRARYDKIDVWLNIAQDSVGAADRQIDRIDQALQRLGDYPESGALREALGAGIRIVPVDNFVLFYRIKDRTVEIVRVFHAARDMRPDLLSD